MPYSNKKFCPICRKETTWENYPNGYCDKHWVAFGSTTHIPGPFDTKKAIDPEEFIALQNRNKRIAFMVASVGIVLLLIYVLILLL